MVYFAQKCHLAKTFYICPLNPRKRYALICRHSHDSLHVYLCVQSDVGLVHFMNIVCICSSNQLFKFQLRCLLRDLLLHELKTQFTYL